MALALAATAIVVLILLSELAVGRVRSSARRCLSGLAGYRQRLRRGPREAYDPGRELRAEQRARELLRSCVNAQEWAMYRDLGFLRVWGAVGGQARRRRRPRAGAGRARAAGGSIDRDGAAAAAPSGAEYAYLIYPHKPIVAYLPQTGAILNEYCVALNHRAAPCGLTRLPDADDVLAKWMLLAADERGLLQQANMHMPGRQVDPEQVHRDLLRLSQWERARGAELRRHQRAPEAAAGLIAGRPRGQPAANGDRRAGGVPAR
jgi:hypothetical protein